MNQIIKKKDINTYSLNNESLLIHNLKIEHS